MTLLLLLSHPPNRLEEEEKEEPTDEASNHPFITTVDFNAKYGEDSKSTVATTCSRVLRAICGSPGRQKSLIMRATKN